MTTRRDGDERGGADARLPRRPIEPLAAPPGQLDRVLGAARYRRHRRTAAALTVSLVFVAGLGGGLALGRDVPREVISAIGDVRADPSPTGSAPETEVAASRTPEDVTATAAPQPTATVTVTPPATALGEPPRGTLAYHGRVLSPTGAPVAGLYVYVGLPGVVGFVPSGPAVGRTGEDGGFALSCPRAPILLAPWPLNAEAKARAAAATWGATFVGGAQKASLAEAVTCSRDHSVDVTRVERGSAVTGQVTVPADCRQRTQGLWLWLHGNREQRVEVQDLADGDTFRIGGLPPGQHTLGAHGRYYPLLVGGGATREQDVVFSCAPTSPSPTTSPTSPTPTDPGTSIPTVLPTGSSSAGSTATPDPTATRTP